MRMMKEAESTSPKEARRRGKSIKAKLKKEKEVEKERDTGLERSLGLQLKPEVELEVGPGIVEKFKKKEGNLDHHQNQEVDQEATTPEEKYTKKEENKGQDPDQSLYTLEKK